MHICAKRAPYGANKILGAKSCLARLCRSLFMSQHSYWAGQEVLMMPACYPVISDRVMLHRYFGAKLSKTDLASSYFPFNTPTVFVFLPVLHPNRSFEISMTIVLILQQGLSESSRSRVSLLHSAQCNVFVFVFVYLSFIRVNIYYTVI